MRLTNTLASEVQDFEPLEPGTVGLYVCGVTPYAEAHVGHAMSAIVYDVFVRYLRWKGNPHGGFVVTYVTNYTDIDDKLIERGHELGRDPLELAQENIDRWEREQQALNLIPPNVRPRVTEEIESIVGLIERIIEQDHAYSTAEGNVYYRVRSKDGYGKLSHRNIDQMLTGTRFEPGEDKEFALDFSLWKAAKAGEPSWPSPWGEGRPGWHIECSAMAQRYLGDQFDIHGGGLDLVFPHHENEIAQSEAAGIEFARIWMHNGLIQFGGEKMAKSVGNVTTVEEALTEWHPDALRLAILGSHYHSPATLSDDVLSAAEQRLSRYMAAKTAPEQTVNERAARLDLVNEFGESFWKVHADFVAAMEDDLATSRALAVLDRLARAINRLSDVTSTDSVRAGKAKLIELTEVLGLRLEEQQDVTEEHRLAFIEAARRFPELIQIDVLEAEQDRVNVLTGVLSLRRQLRDANRFDEADELRQQIESLGYELRDTPDGGTGWKRAKVSRLI